MISLILTGETSFELQFHISDLHLTSLHIKWPLQQGRLTLPTNMILATCPRLLCQAIVMLYQVMTRLTFQS